MEGRWTICGTGQQEFWYVLRALVERGWLWSSLLDRQGDWAVSTQLCSREVVLDLLQAENLMAKEIQVVEHGPLNLLLRDVLRVSDPDIFGKPRVEV